MVYISTVSRRGAAHSDWNEDNFYFKQTDSVIIGGVFDGCSSGKDSYFASKLFANVFRSTIEEAKEDVCIETFLSLVNTFFKNLYKAINTIGLDMDETLSTAVLFVYEMDTTELFVKFFGDGVAYSNKNLLNKFNNNEANQPDYVGYSLNDILENTNFQVYWEKKKSYCAKTNDFSISTDGIFSFKKVNDSEPNIDIESYLASDTFLYKNPASLKRKLNILKNKGYEHDDDITIIRIINEQSHEQNKTI